MMDADLFIGNLVRLTAEEPKTFAQAHTRWSRNSEYWRLMASDPARLFSLKQTQKWIEKEMENEAPAFIIFSIRTLQDDRLIGEVSLDGIDGQHGDAFLGIGIGDRSYWNQGMGTDALRLILRYAFQELNLQRVSLNVFEYNPRAIRVYEKAGFQVEGRMRKFLHRGGRRWDLIYMGLLREEWQP